MTKLWRTSLLFFLVLVVDRTTSSASSNDQEQLTKNTVTVESDCYSYGCPNYPRDVQFDNEARRALAKLVKKIISDEEEEEPFNVEALEELKRCGDTEKATMTLMGYKGGRKEDQINQDRSFTLSPFHLFGNDALSSNSIGKNLNCRLLGVFDGHGHLGEVVSEFAVKEFPKRLAEKLEKALNETVLDESEILDNIVKSALVETFVEIDKEVPTGGQGGCTASVIFQLNSKLYIANAGDSVSFIAAYISTSDTTHIVYVSREDKPHLPDEKKRIESMGGTVYIPSKRQEEYGEVSRAYYIDKETGSSYGLAMSRSIGDWDVIGVIAEPIVDVVDINEILENLMTTCTAPDSEETGDETTTAGEEESETCKLPEKQDVGLFAVSATDGAIDFLDPDEIAAPLAVAFFRQNAKHPLKACGDVVNEAAAGWQLEEGGRYRDDIAVAAAKISLEQVS